MPGEIQNVIDAVRSRLHAEIDAQLGAVARLMDALRAIDFTENLSETLASIARGAATQAPRVALFIVNGDQLAEWPVAGVPPMSQDSVRIGDASAGVVGAAVRNRVTTCEKAGGALTFSGLQDGRIAVAIPLLLDQQPVGVLYGDEGTGSTSDATRGTWQDALEVIANHGATRLGYLTALRTAQAMRWLSRAISTPVPGGMPGRARHFHDEPVQTLAGGDASVLR